MNTLKLMNNID